VAISIETENAGTYPDVDEAQIIDLSERLADGMGFLIVHDSSREEHAQAAPGSEGSYVVEYCTADRHHYQATVSTPAQIGAFLAAWAWKRDGWKDGFKWTELGYLRGA